MRAEGVSENLMLCRSTILESGTVERTYQVTGSAWLKGCHTGESVKVWDMNRRKTGTLYEQKAAVYLQQQGYQILETNFRCRYGEIDLVARDGAYVVFVEVKYRRNKRMGEGQYAVDGRKQYRICFTAAWYLMKHRLPESTPCRFDVVCVEGEQVTLIQDAFPYQWS